MKGIFAFDIDGTLTHQGDGIDPLVVQRLKQLVDEGWKVALLTGRIYSYAKQILDHLDFPYFLAVQNGAELLLMPEKRKIRQNFLSPLVLPQIDKAMVGLPEDYIIYSGMDKGDFCYYRKKRFTTETLKYLQILEEICGIPWKESDFTFEKGRKFPLVKCFGKKSEMALLHERLLKIQNIEVSMIRDPIGDDLYLNLITHPEANKGSVIHFLREYYNTSFVIAAGDDNNDRKMLLAADIRIVIETAPKELLEIANVIAKPAEELGIIAGIEEAIHHASH